MKKTVTIALTSRGRLFIRESYGLVKSALGKKEEISHSITYDVDVDLLTQTPAEFLKMVSIRTMVYLRKQAKKSLKSIGMTIRKVNENKQLSERVDALIVAIAEKVRPLVYA